MAPWLPGFAVGGLGLAGAEPVGNFNALHEGMILIGDFVSPSPESAAAVDVEMFEFALDFVQKVVASGERYGISMVQFRGKDRNHFAVGIDESDLAQSGFDLGGFVLRIGATVNAAFAKDRPCAIGVRSIFRRKVGRKIDAPEGDVRFGKIYGMNATQHFRHGSAKTEAEELNFSRTKFTGSRLQV